MNEVARMTKQVHDTNDVILLKIKSDNRQDYAKHDNPFDLAKSFNGIAHRFWLYLYRLSACK